MSIWPCPVTIYTLLVYTCKLNIKYNPFFDNQGTEGAIKLSNKDTTKLFDKDVLTFSDKDKTNKKSPKTPQNVLLKMY